MIITTILAYFVSRYLWVWKMPVSLVVTGAFLIVDLAFFGANFVKVAQGEWFPLLIGFAVYIVFTTWKKGRELLASRLQQGVLSLQRVRETRMLPYWYCNFKQPFLRNPDRNAPQYQTQSRLARAKHHRHNPRQKKFLTFRPKNECMSKISAKASIVSFGRILWRIPMSPILRKLTKNGLKIDPSMATYVLSRNTRGSRSTGMALWREKSFGVSIQKCITPHRIFPASPKPCGRSWVCKSKIEQTHKIRAAFAKISSNTCRQRRQGGGCFPFPTMPPHGFCSGIGTSENRDISNRSTALPPYFLPYGKK